MQHRSTSKIDQKRLIRLLLSATILLLSALLTVRAYTQNSGSVEPEISVSQSIPFAVGEQIDFHVMFGLIPAGKARLAVIGMDTLNGQSVYHAISTARSAKAYDLIFKVRDSVETWFDADSIYSHHFRKRLQEGPYRDEKIVQFDPGRERVLWWDDGVEKPPLTVPARVQDVLSAGYKVRTMPLVVGDTLAVKTHDVNKTYDLMVIVHGKERVETEAGNFNCFKVEPVLRSGGIFKKEKGARVFVWVTDDELRIPVKMQSKVSFGSITALMQSYRPGARPEMP